MTSQRTLIAGNWKMNGRRAALSELALLCEALQADAAGAEVLVCPPACLLPVATDRFPQAPLVFGAQDCSPHADGAHTGDLSAGMLADAGARFVIVGHSERRADHGETNALVQAKAIAAQSAGLTPIVCVGETRAQREAGVAEAVVRAQLRESLPIGDAPLVVAYEPVWAIGSGLTPTTGDIAVMHTALREEAGGVRLLYGGSVKPENAREILTVANVDGALVGGASLMARDFLAIIRAAQG